MSNVFHILTKRPLDPVTGVSPHARECLPCFVRRMTADGECPGTFGWTEHYRALRCRRATGLIKRMTHEGAECDCGVTTVVWIVNPALWEESGSGDLVEPQTLPECLGVRPNSTQACDNWAAPHDIAL